MSSLKIGQAAKYSQDIHQFGIYYIPDRNDKIRATRTLQKKYFRRIKRITLKKFIGGRRSEGKKKSV